MKIVLRMLSCILIFALLPIQNALAVQIPMPQNPLQGVVALSPKENVFSLDSGDHSYNEYILLDEGPSETSRFFVMNKNHFNRNIGFGTSQKFDPNAAGSLAKFINSSEFYTTGNGQGLSRRIFSPVVRQYIDENHVWTTEGLNSINYPESEQKDSQATCGLALLSYTEWSQYHTKIGYKDDMDGNSWYLRTAPGSRSELAEDNYNMSLRIGAINVADGGLSVQQLGAMSVYVRPCYWLHKDFFKEVRINLDNAGENVLATLKNNYTISELKNIYTNAELIKIGYTVYEIGEDIATIDFRSTNDMDLVDIVDAGIDAEIYNSSLSDKEFTLAWEIQKLSHWENNHSQIFVPSESGSKSVFISADSSLATSINFPNPPKGIVRIKVVVASGNNVVAEAEKDLCYISEYRRQFLDEYSTLGVCSPINNPMEELEINAMDKAGIRTRRVEISWNGVERVKGEFDFSNSSAPMAAMEQRGLDTYLLLSYSNELYCPTPTVTDETLIPPSRRANFYGPRTPNQVQAFCRYALRLLEAYPQVNVVEIYNEPNFSYWQPGTTGKYAMPDYANLVKAVSMEIKAVRPDVQVVAGAFGNGGSATAMGCQREFLNEDVADYIDGVSTHPYYSNSQHFHVLAHLQRLNLSLINPASLSWLTASSSISALYKTHKLWTNCSIPSSLLLCTLLIAFSIGKTTSNAPSLAVLSGYSTIGISLIVRFLFLSGLTLSRL
jgi:hypothetical protein